MRVKTIRLAGVTRHQSTEVHLPERGVVLVTGPNGSGKSSLYEAVSLALWGKPVRPAWTPWSGGSGEVAVETYDGLVVKRTRKGGRSQLKWNAEDFQTATGAQRDLLGLIGDSDVWACSCVFDVGRMRTFAAATDSQRKKMLEAVLGVGRFDAAMDKAKAELHTVEIDAARQQGMVVAARSAEDARHADLEKALAARETSRPEGDLEALRRKLTASTFARDEAGTQEEAFRRKAGAAASKAAEHMAEVRRLTSLMEDRSKPACPECGRLYEEDDRRRALVDLGHKVVAQKKGGVEARASAASYGVKASEYRTAHNTLAAEVVRLSSRVDELEAYEKLREGLDAEVERAQEAVVSAIEHRVAAVKRLEALDARAAVLRLAQKVFGMRGLRSHVLGEALQSLEGSINYWMERMYPGLEVSLQSRRERADGKGHVEELTILVGGVGHAEGYNGCSLGERRRLDVPIMFGFAEMAAAVNGTGASTLFADEADLGLDREGLDGLIAGINEVRKDRCVVVISHSRDLCKAIRPDAHYEVADGVVSRVA